MVKEEEIEFLKNYFRTAQEAADALNKALGKEVYDQGIVIKMRNSQPAEFERLVFSAWLHGKIRELNIEELGEEEFNKRMIAYTGAIL